MSDLFVARGERLAARKVAGEMVILSADDSSLFVLNARGHGHLGGGRRRHAAHGDCRRRHLPAVRRSMRRRRSATRSEFVSALGGAGVDAHLGRGLDTAAGRPADAAVL